MLTIGQLIPGDSVQLYHGVLVEQSIGWFLLAILLGIRHFFLPSSRSDTELPSATLQSHGWNRRSLSIGIGVLVLYLLVAASCYSVIGRGDVRAALNATSQWFVLAIVVWSASQLLITRARWIATLTLFIGIGVATCQHGMYQTFVEKPNDLARFLQDPDLFVQQEGFFAPPDTASRRLLQSRLEDKEPVGPFAMTNSLAGYLACVTLAFVPLFWHRPGALHSNLPRAFALLLGLAVLLVTLALTKSRAAWVALSLGIVWCTLNQSRFAPDWRRYWFRTGMCLGFLGVAVCAALWIWDADLFLQAATSAWYRCEYWVASSRMIWDHPIFGVGAGGFQDHYSQYKLVEASETPADPHNWLVEIAATTGLPVLFTLLIVIGFTIQGATSAISAKNSNRAHEAPDTESFPHSTLGYSLFGAVSFAFACVWIIPGLVGPPPPISIYLASLPLSLCVAWAFHSIASSSPIASSNDSDGPSDTAKPFPVQPIALTLLIVWSVHHFASGGWLVAGSMNIVATAFGVLLYYSQPNFDPTDIEARRNSIGDGGVGILYRVAPLLITIGLFAAWQWLVLYPVESIKMWRAFGQARTLDASIAAAEQASQSDPWSPLPHAMLTEAAKSRVLRAQTMQELERSLSNFDKAAQSWLETNPANWVYHEQVGRHQLDLRSHLIRRAKSLKPSDAAPLLSWINQLDAAATFERAVRLNPNHAGLRVQASVCWLMFSQPSRAKTHCDFAWTINDQTPHLEKQIWMQLVYLPLPITITGGEGTNSSGDTSANDSVFLEKAVRDSLDPGLQPNWIRAEPLALALRKHLAAGE